MRVLHLFPRFRPQFAGDGLYFEKLWPALADAGGNHDVAVFTTKQPAETPRVMPPGMDLFYLRRDDSESARRVLLRYYLWLIRNARRYSVIHSRTHIDRFLVSHLIAKLFGVAIVYSATLDDSPPYILRTYRPQLWPFVTWMLKKTLARLVVINSLLYDESVPVLGAERVTIIPQGVALPGPSQRSRESLRDENDIPRDALVQLYVGSISRRKDVLFLIENFAALPAGSRPHILVLVGPALEDDYKVELDARIGELGVGDRVRFVGYRDDPAPFYRLADVFVFASWLEGFPNVLVEAMAHSLPILARRLEGVTDFVIADGVTGILFDGAADYRRALARLEAEPRWGEALGSKARAKAAGDYSLPAVAQRYVDLYREVTS
jgi:glycosyltransferase involved in cell wall biosynthesis